MSARERLLDALTGLSARDGYVKLTVERVLAAAGLSRATFYQYFASVEDCFSSAYREHAERLVGEVAASVGGAECRELAMLDALAGAAVSRPDMARLLMREGLAAGRASLAERDALIASIERAMAPSAVPRSRIDLPPALLIGGAFRFLSMCLSDGGTLDGASRGMREWALAFARRPSQPSWSARFDPVPQRHVTSWPAQSDGTRAQGTPRERIRYAIAATVREKGYRDMTVADIVAAAGVSRRTFYNEFASKADAFVSTYEHGFQEALAASAPAFFTAAVWPERVWQGAQAFTGFFARRPLVAHLGFVECYAVGPGFESRVHETQLAFTLFLEEGYRQRPEAGALSRACSALAAATIFEAAFHGSRHSPGLLLRCLQPLAVYIALAPFIGLEKAGSFVTGKLSEVRRPARLSA
jgi:AcrR family transcriptional regulator